MDCPQCQSDEIDASGKCPACGYRLAASEMDPESDAHENRSFAGMIELDYAERAGEPGAKDERPQWREELSKRLQAIKQKRESMNLAKRSRSADPVLSNSATPASAPQPQVISPAKFVEGPPARKPIQKPRPPIPKQKTLQPLSQEVPAERPPAKPAEPEEIQDLIDNAISRRSHQDSTFDAPAGFFHSHGGQPQGYEAKLILLSRTLSGLVDLIVVILCTGILIIAADFFSGIIALDAVSYLSFSVVFLLTYFFYSLFFLTASNQTIGMMITDLRVVDAYEQRPSFRQLVHRCWGYLVSLLGLGFGLLWGLFDRESLCFHDRISDTHVVRL